MWRNREKEEGTMKSNSLTNIPKIAALLLTLTFMFSLFAGTALAATSGTATEVTDDSISVNKTQLQTNKINISNIKMTGSKSKKFVLIEQGAIEYAAEQGENVGITTNYVSISFPASAIVNSAEWKKAANSSPNFNFVIEMDDSAGMNLTLAFPTNSQSSLGATAVSSTGFSVEFYLRGGNNSYTYINTLSTDMQIVYNYSVEYRASNKKAAEKSLALVWADTDKKLNSTKITNVLLDSKVTLADTTVEVRSPYTTGTYILASKTNADNTTTVLGGTTTSNNNQNLTGQVNTSGVASWAASDVASMQAASVVPSDLSGKNLTAPISRAEFAAYIVRLLNVSTAGTTNPFSDVSSSNTYYSEILAAANAGLVAGRTSTTFAPDANITRQEIAVLFTRALNYTNAQGSADTTKLSAMSDASQIADWAKGSAAVCVNASLIAGKDGNRFAPLENTSWTEAVVILNRLKNVIG